MRVGGSSYGPYVSPAGHPGTWIAQRARYMGNRRAVKHWSLWSVQVKLIKMGGRLVRHARRLVFQLAEGAVPREVFRQVLERIGGLHPAPG